MLETQASKATAAAFSEDGKNLTSLPVEFLFAFTGWPTQSPAEIKDGPLGHRFLYFVERGHFEEPKLRGTLIRPSGDWATTHANGTKRLDVRLALRTEDGADILMEYQGFIAGAKIHVGGLFQVSDERYNWLNNLQFVGMGFRNSDKSLTYMFYALA